MGHSLVGGAEQQLELHEGCCEDSDRDQDDKAEEQRLQDERSEAPLIERQPQGTPVDLRFVLCLQGQSVETLKRVGSQSWMDPADE